MSWIVWIIFGLIAGAIAKAIHPGKDPGGWIITILIGIGGALLGGWISTRLNMGDVDGFNLKSMAIAVAGSVILLWLYSMVSRRR